jgi:DNA-binding transcriptional MocR family regulator
MLWAELPGRIDLAPVRTRARAAGFVFGAGDVFFPAPPERCALRLNCAKASESELVQGIEALGSIVCEEMERAPEK